MLFYSIELLLVHITCLHIYFVNIYLHLLAQDARLCPGRGKDHRILWTIVNASGRLRLHGFGGLRCACRREASRSPPPSKYPSLLCPWRCRCKCSHTFWGDTFHLKCNPVCLCTSTHRLFLGLLIPFAQPYPPKTYYGATPPNLRPMTVRPLQAGVRQPSTAMHI